MLGKIETVLRQGCRLPLDRPVVVGVSGGPDSLCLLDVLHQAGYALIAAHFNHKLRPEADEEAAAVARTAEKAGLPFVSESQDVRAFAEAESLSIEEAARTLRYRFLFAQARKRQAQAVAVGHTADDQVETVLMHFIRGAGLSGLKGMGYRTVIPAFDAVIPLVRPLLDVWREETVVYCAAHGLRPILDASNMSLNFFRNRLRHVLIPTLESYNPRIREVLWRTAQALSGDHDTLSETLAAAWKACVHQAGAGYVAFEVSALAAFPVGLQRNMVRRALEHVRPGLRNVDFAALQRAAAFIADPARPPQLDLVGGVYLFREGGHFYVAAWEADLPDEGWPQMAGNPLPLALPGEVSISDEWRLVAEEWDVVALAWEHACENADPFKAWLDAERLAAPLEVRGRRPGDRFQPLGMDGHSLKMSDFFVNVKLPRRARQRWPLVCAGEAILWVPGYRPAHPFRMSAATRRVIYLALSRTDSAKGD